MSAALRRCCFASLAPAFRSTPSTSRSIFIRHASTSLRPNSSYLRPTAHVIRSLHASHSQRQQAAAQEVEASTQGNGLITKFEELETQGLVHQNVVRTITRDFGHADMTEVQTATINEALNGKDMIAQARTGTGKTLGFLVPILQRIIQADPSLANSGRGRTRTTADEIRAIIISPTRELAEQIAVEATRLTRNTSVIVQTAVGGTQKMMGLRRMQREGCHILVGTPGRLKDIFSDRYSGVSAPGLEALVFDEADRLMDQGFWPEIQEIMELLPRRDQKDRQTMMFSATVPGEVVDLVEQTLKPDFEFVRTVKENETPTHARVPQKIVKANGLVGTMPTLVELCLKAIKAAEETDGRPFKAIVYFSSTAQVTIASSIMRKLVDPSTSTDKAYFSQSNALYPAKIFDIHSKLTQSARTSAATMFRACKSGILLSSDVTARGMDFPNVTHVIQMGLPQARDTYIHRLGRTARAGKEGEGWLIISDVEMGEARRRLHGLPLQSDRSLESAEVDLVTTPEEQIPEQTARIVKMIKAAAAKVPRTEKAGVFRAMIGVFGWLTSKKELINEMNDLAVHGWGMEQPPGINPTLARKMGIDRIPGLVIGYEDSGDDDSRGGGRGGGGGGGGRGGGGFGGGRSGGGGFGGGSRGGDPFGSSGRGGDSSGGRSGGDPFGSRSGGYGGGRNNDRSSSFGGRSSYGGGDRSGGGSSYGGGSSRGSGGRY